MTIRHTSFESGARSPPGPPSKRPERDFLLLPMLIEVGGGGGEAALICRGAVEEKVASRVLDMALTSREGRLTLHKPQLGALRRRLRTTTQYVSDREAPAQAVLALFARDDPVDDPLDAAHLRSDGPAAFDIRAVLDVPGERRDPPVHHDLEHVHRDSLFVEQGALHRCWTQRSASLALLCSRIGSRSAWRAISRSNASANSTPRDLC